MNEISINFQKKNINFNKKCETLFLCFLIIASSIESMSFSLIVKKIK